MKRGEIRWYKFDNPDKKRPILVLTRESIIHYLNEVTVAPVTTKIRNIPSEVLLDNSDGLFSTCVVNCDHLQTVAKDKIGDRITTLSDAKMKRISYAIGFALNL